MSNPKPRNGNLSQEQCKDIRLLLRIAGALYPEVEAQLLEGFADIEARPRDAFDTLVLVSIQAMAVSVLGVGEIDLMALPGDFVQKLAATVVAFHLAMKLKQIKVSAEFPFSAETMDAAATPIMEIDGDVFLNRAVDDAARRLVPIFLSLAQYFASAYPSKSATA